MLTTLHCVPKNIPDISDFDNFWPKYSWHNLPSNDHSVSHLTQRLLVHYLGKSQPAKYHFFYPMRYDCLINIMRKNTFCSHFWHYGWDFIQLSIFQLPVVKLLEALAHYVNTCKQTFSPFIDSSIDNVLLQTNPGTTSCFLTSQTFLNYLVDTLLHDSQTL